MSDQIPSTPEGSRPQPRYRGRRFEQASGEAFRQVNAYAITSLVLGILSFLTMFSWVMILIPIAGIICGVVALQQIRWAVGEMTGRGIAIAGLSCSITLWILGSGFFVFVLFNEVPIGYTLIEWEEMQPEKGSNELIPKKLLELDGKYVYIRGFMYPGRQNVNIEQFILVPSPRHCQFCARDLESTEMVKVKTTGDTLAHYSSHQMGVGGILHVDKVEAVKPLGGFPYHIEADYVFQK